ncbi:MAG: hypothetical protein E7021_00160 [Alphaproteobacteria bacterium]|nr:hypothetical protein [Alphaproteobacteria bacterium]
MFLSVQEKEIFLTLTRWLAYLLITISASFSLWGFGHIFHDTAFAEHGLVENLQLTTLSATILSFLLMAGRKTPYRALCILFGTLCLTAFCRELDAWFDNLWVLGWQFALLFPVIAIFYIARHLTDFRKTVIVFCQSPAFFLMYCATIVFGPIAQCIGHRDFFVDVLGVETDNRLVRRLLEESVEYIGYILLLLSAFEFYWIFIRSKGTLNKQKRKIKRK